MPKKIFKIPHFNDGIVGNMSKRDIPTTAMSYGENVDSRQSGTVRGIPADTLEHASFDGRVMTALLGSDNELIGQDSSKQFKSYDIDADTVTNIGSVTSDFASTMVAHNSKVYCAMTSSFRSGDPSTPKWVGGIGYGQFGGSAPSGKVVTDAECKSYAELQEHGSNSFSPFIQILNDDNTSFGGGAVVSFSGTGTVFKSDTNYFWAISLVYDGYQESPLIKGIVDSNGNFEYYFVDSPGSDSNVASILIGFGEETAGDFNQRISHINLYRAESTTDVPGEYRLVKSLSIEQSGTAADYNFFADTGINLAANINNTDTTLTFNQIENGDLRVDDILKIGSEELQVQSVNYGAETALCTRGFNSTTATSHSSGDDVLVSHNRAISTSTAGNLFSGGTFTNLNYFLRIYDTGTSGATYEDNTGIADTLETSSVDYAINTSYGQWMFVGDCSKADINNADRYIFRSKPMAYSQFDWSSDFVRIDEQPTALAGFGGRLFVFSGGNTYRVNPDFMSLEDTFRGVGALNENMVVTTNYGMFHADENNIYINDGRHSAPIGTPILENEWDTIGWSDLAKTSTGDEAYASMEFDPINRRLLVFGTTSGTDLIVWSYDVERKRWDHYPTLGLVSTTAIGPNGKVFAVKGDTGNGFDLYSLFSSSTRKNWKIRTKDFDFNSDSGYVWLYDLSAYGSGNLDIDYYVDGSGTAAGPTVSTVDGVRRATVASGDKKSHSIALEVASAATSDTLDNVTIQFRPSVIQE